MLSKFLCYRLAGKVFHLHFVYQNKEREERCKRGREHLNIIGEKLTSSERQRICHKKTKQNTTFQFKDPNSEISTHLPS